MIVPRSSIKIGLEKATQEYHSQLTEDQEALNYLVDGRRITREAIDHFRLGVVRDPLDGHENFKNRISFPYYTATGITTIRFRRLGDRENDRRSKFLFITGDVPRLYNAPVLLQEQHVALCEGETDTITCWMAGIAAVGIPGANAWSPAFRRVFRNREIKVLADNDEVHPKDPKTGEPLKDWRPKGELFAQEIYRSLEGCEIIKMPRGHDVSSFAAEYGLDALRAKVGL